MTNVSADHRLSVIPRLSLGIAGASVALLGIQKKGVSGVLLVGVGLSALVRALRSTFDLDGLGFRSAIKLERRIDVNAPLEVVFDFWKNFANFTRFMSYVQMVEVNESFGFTWTVVGPVGIPIHWDSGLSAFIPNQLISWRSFPGALISNTGHIFFRNIKKGNATRVEVSLSFAPPAGLLGYEAIKVLGFDPRSRIDGDLTKMKILVEEEFQRPHSSHSLSHFSVRSSVRNLSI